MTRELRPTRPPWTRPGGPATASLVLGIGLAFGMAAFGNRYGPGLGWTGVVAVAALLLFPLAAVTGYLVMRRRMRLVESGGTLTHTDQRGRRTGYGRDRIGAVRPVVFATRMERTEATVLTGLDGRALLVLWHRTWDAWELNRLWGRLGWPVAEREDVPVSSAGDRFGLRLPVYVRHPVRTGMLVALGVLGYVAGWVAFLVFATA